MKKNPIFKIAILSCLFFLFSAKVNAQPVACNYGVINGHACTVDVIVEFYTTAGWPNSPCKGVVLGGISPNTSAFASCASGCGGGPPITNVKVTITALGGSSITGPPLVSVNSGTTTNSGTSTSTPCTGGSSSFNMSWSAGSTLIN